VALEIDGQIYAGMPDVWVCTGGRLVEVGLDGTTNPWDCVCGCVLHQPPPTEHPTRDRGAVRMT
jgi:hypothetical protein